MLPSQTYGIMNKGEVGSYESTAGPYQQETSVILHHFPMAMSFRSIPPLPTCCLPCTLIFVTAL